jgi:predicted RNA-binding Zn-ribbon protein involved in translation (DUF1610 family)
MTICIRSVDNLPAPLVCPECGFPSKNALVASGLHPSAKSGFTICPKCGAIHRFTETELRLATDEDILQLGKRNPEGLAALLAASKAVAELRRKRAEERHENN